MDRKLFNQTKNKARRCELRGNMPKAEQILWYQLKGKQLDGHKFRRQHGIGNYVVDFYCSSARLVVEVDGDSHFDPRSVEYDAQRDKYLNENGLFILRFVNTDIYEAIDDVVEKIRLWLASYSFQSTSNPL